MADNKPATVSRGEIKTFSISNSADTLELAKDVAKYIKELKLYQNIQGKEFVNVEGWQYAGSRLGIIPVMDSIQNISNDTELKYEAKVHLLNLHTGATVGAGFAICSNKEQGKKYYQEFAIASMAQTRAIGKAYRNLLAWIIRAAGYEPTPAEEMEYGNNEPGTSAEPIPAPKQTPAPATAPKPSAEASTTPPASAATPTTEPTTPATSIKYATAKQKEEIIRLLNNPVITRPEKTKMLLNINKLDEERADQAMAKLRKAIEDRENTGEEEAPVAAPGGTFPAPGGAG